MLELAPVLLLLSAFDDLIRTSAPRKCENLARGQTDLKRPCLGKL